MRILIDECLPADLREVAAKMGHEYETVRRAGYGSKKNGELLALAEGRWDLLLTSDKNIRHQQNMAGRKISILILRTKSNRMEDLLPLMGTCAEAIRNMLPGLILEVGPLKSD